MDVPALVIILFATDSAYDVVKIKPNEIKSNSLIANKTKSLYSVHNS